MACCFHAAPPRGSPLAGSGADHGGQIGVAELWWHPAGLAAAQFDADQMPAAAQKGGAVVLADQLEAPLHGQLSVAGHNPRAQGERIAEHRWQKVVVLAVADHHGPVQPLVVGHAQAHGLGVCPANFFAPLHVHRVVGVLVGVDVCRLRRDGQRKRVDVIPFHGADCHSLRVPVMSMA